MINNDTQAITVSELNKRVKGLLEGSFNYLWVEGEISNLARPASGHWYFSLKDRQSQVRCAMFRGHNQRIKFMPKDGMQLLAYIKVSLYTGRGDYQLIVEHLEEMGIGALQRAFEQLKKKLGNEGLFDQQHKQPLPIIPQRLGVITSASGAAIHDILHVLQKRYPLLPVIIYPSAVQGDQAAIELIKAVKLANQRQECDLLIIARGGGSLEDLWPFNDEQLARTIFSSNLPIVSGVGHEVDFTIADFIADYRAPTPSAAAEAISPDQKVLQQQVNDLAQALINQIESRVEQQWQQIDYFDKRLLQQHPQQQLDNQQQLLIRLQQSLYQLQKNEIDHKRAQFRGLTQTLNALSPLATLGRGYAIAKNMRTDKIIVDSQEVDIDDQVQLRLATGSIQCRVNDKS